MEFAPPIRLDDGFVALRPLKLEDVPAYVAAFREDPDLGRLVGVETDPDEVEVREKIERQTRGVEERRHVQFAIADATSDALWGDLMVHSLSAQHRRAELGFFVVAGQRGNRVAAHAVALALDWLFGDLELERVEITTTPDNAAIPALAARLGFQHEGLLRGRNFERGKRVDLVWFGLLREEWHGL